MKALCVGLSSLETTCLINEELKEGNNYEVLERDECCGGRAGNVAYMLAKWGVNSYIASMLGSDDSANKIKTDFSNSGVNCDYIETSFDKPTSSTIITINKINKNNTVIGLPSKSNLKKFSGAVEADLLFFDGYERNSSLMALDKNPKAISFLSTNIYNQDIIEIGMLCNYIIINKKVAEKFSAINVDFNNSSTLVNIYNKIKQKFQKSEIIITLGERGVLYSINGNVKIMPPVVVNVVDSYGAGDIFSGAFSYSILRNFGLEKSIAYASIAASLSTTKITSRKSIPSIADVSNYYDSKFGKENNPNKEIDNVNLNIPEKENDKQAFENQTKLEDNSQNFSTQNPVDTPSNSSPVENLK